MGCDRDETVNEYPEAFFNVILMDISDATVRELQTAKKWGQFKK